SVGRALAQPGGAQLPEGERPPARRGGAARRAAAESRARLPLPAAGGGHLQRAWRLRVGRAGAPGRRAPRRRHAPRLLGVGRRDREARAGVDGAAGDARRGLVDTPPGGAAVTGAAFATPVPSDAAFWFAVWTRNQHERRVSEQLRRKHFEVFLPVLRVPSSRRDKRVILAQPLFPGYLFLRFAPSRAGYVSIASTEGVVRVLGGRWDAVQPNPDEQVEAVHRLVTSADGARAVPWLRVGD